MAILAQIILVFTGASIGGVCRYALGKWIQNRHTLDFPVATMVVNGSGALCIGLIWAWLGHHDASWVTAASPLLLLGFLGGYTTVSSFALDALQLFQQRRWTPAAWYFFGTYAICLIAVFVGVGITGLLTK